MKNQKKDIRLSVITLCLDNSKGIIHTMDGMLAEKYTGMEWIIVRGKDVSLDRLKECGAKWVEIVAEKDESIAHLMNKALQIAVGSWVLFMPAGYCFYSIWTLALYDKRLADCYDLVAGSTLIKECFGVYPDCAIPLERMEGDLPFRLESTFFKRQLLLENPFDERYEAALDFELLLRLKAKGAVDLVAEEPVSLSPGDMFPKSSLGLRALTERRRALGKSGGASHLLGWCLAGARLLLEWLIGLVAPRALRHRGRLSEIQRKQDKIDQFFDEMEA